MKQTTDSTFPHPRLASLILRLRWGCLFYLVAGCGVFTAGAEEARKPVYDVWLSNRFQYESDATGSDADFKQHLSLSGRDLMNGHMDLRLSGVNEFDLNGNDTTDAAYDQTWPRLYEAAVDLHDYDALSHLVLGRQYLPNVDYLHFDGLSLSLWEDEKVGLFAFGGQPVSVYTSTDGEWLAGGGVRVRPLSSTEIQADAYGIHDTGEDVLASALRMSQYFAPGFGDTVEARWIEDDFRDLSARLFYQNSGRFDVTGRVFWQAAQLGEDARTYDTRNFSEYSRLMGPSEEQLSLSLDGNYYLGEHYTLSAGGGYRYILDQSKEGGENVANVDSGRLSAGFSVADVPIDGLTFDLSASYYSHPDESFYDVTGELGYTFTPRFRASGGVTHQLYDYTDELLYVDRLGRPIPDENGGEQMSDVFFVESQYKLSNRWRFVTRGEYEVADELAEDAYMVSVRVDYHFRTASGK
ncbi:MAG: hypothetical protein A3K19_30895 [Lentisphaerae bacterium RIFOXYB12_FULL_65_16]|nr:MAG: hypothetical protein A3K18_04000 [Lentisphaerae bacterium RIFOXYA12_64_32]OGV88826.1 MAG: hypothetical protein A3K19_30895 [Lentisphaerae bacterium RIFOXYB12_FULL_65_16]